MNPKPCFMKGRSRCTVQWRTADLTYVRGILRKRLAQRYHIGEVRALIVKENRNETDLDTNPTSASLAGPAEALAPGIRPEDMSTVQLFQSDEQVYWRLGDDGHGVQADSVTSLPVDDKVL